MVDSAFKLWAFFIDHSQTSCVKETMQVDSDDDFEDTLMKIMNVKETLSMITLTSSNTR